MKISLLVVGRLKEPFLVAAEEDYKKRLRPYCTFNVVECKDEAALLAAIPAGAVLYAFDERGASMTSTAFSSELLGEEASHGGGRPICFAIGGADGHSDAVRQRARRLISFGQLTIAHRLVRILVVEQLYRAFRILRGEPYHRE
ncbi:MAG: 23S rRNA (pseudouridine(1915)-N(3))-methyltransferase RlmH [Kofleriaceae bacterium]